MHKILVILQVIFCIVLILSIMLQPSKSDGITSLLSGSSDTFFAKNKGKTKEAFLVRLTVISAIAVGVTTLALNLIK